jgi:flagellar basal body-associated protein FliL
MDIPMAAGTDASAKAAPLKTAEDSWDAPMGEKAAGAEAKAASLKTAEDSWDAPMGEKAEDSAKAAPPKTAEDSWDSSSPDSAKEALAKPDDSSLVKEEPKESDDDFDFEAALNANNAGGEKPEENSLDSSSADDHILGDSAKSDFLKSLDDDDESDLPKKVELDLDGIFSEAKREADNLSPEATHSPEDAPLPTEPAISLEPDPLAKPHTVKVAHYKLFIFIGVIFLAVSALGYGAYRIFFQKPAPSAGPPPIDYSLEDDLATTRPKNPGVFTLERFYVNLGSETSGTVVEMEILLHYKDDSVADVIRAEMTVVRDLIYRLTRSTPPSVLTELDERRRLQANLLRTLNNLPAFSGDPADPDLTYVQIGLLKKR